jgi:hypothetical protein
MYAVRRLVVSIVLVVSVVLLTAGAVFAQTGAGNPSGGTTCRPATRAELQVLPSGDSVDMLLRSWFDTWVARRQTATSTANWLSKLVAVRRMVR